MTGISNSDKASLRKHRQENFEVKVALMDDQFLFNDEMSIDMTFNGHQWRCFQLTPEEADKLAMALLSNLPDKYLTSKKIDN